MSGGEKGGIIRVMRAGEDIAAGDEVALGPLELAYRAKPFEPVLGRAVADATAMTDVSVEVRE